MQSETIGKLAEALSKAQGVIENANLRGAYLGGASFICNKYQCHLSWGNNGAVYICIGCECRPVEEYKQMAEDLGKKHDWEWWDKSGRYVFEFLCQEAERYRKKEWTR